MKLKHKRKEIEKLENDKATIVSKMAESQNLPSTSTYEDLDKLEIDISDDEKYQTLLCKPHFQSGIEILSMHIFLYFTIRSMMHVTCSM